MNYRMRGIATIVAGFLSLHQVNAQSPKLSPPPQDAGFPYTKSARPRALEAIKGTTAIFVGGRYAFINGYKVRLDTKDILRTEAVMHNTKLFVPEAFASLITQKEFNAKPVPNDLITIADKWVFEVKRTTVRIPASVETMYIDDKNYFSAADLAKCMGKQVLQTKRGLLLISDKPITYKGEDDKVLDDCVITLFDTPEKLADPDIATEYIPSLKAQGKWTNYVKVTPEQQKILNGPETKWKMVPESEFDYTGFNKTLLGSAVPPPGVYPRILFSEADIPMLYKRIASNKVGQKSLIEVEYLLKHSWWDASTSDGRIFQKLASGDLSGLEWPSVAAGAPATSVPQQFKDEKPGIHNSHVAYVPECLADMALYCLLTNDDMHGKMAATAIANYFKLREPLIDEWNAVSESEFSTSYTRPDGAKADVGGNGANTAWRNIHGICAQMNLGLSLDFAGKWMTAEEKDIMRRVIAKATYGRRGYGQDGSIRFRDINWVSWDLPNFLAVTAIDGLEGFDKEAYQSNAETVRAFCEWGIDDNGVIYESNGKTPGGCQFHTLSMIALARRGLNLWGHPHIRKLLQGQMQMTSPDGKVVVNSGTQYVPFSQQHFSLQTINEYKAFYPDNLCADYLLSQPTVSGKKEDEADRAWIFNDFNAENYKYEVSKLPRLRMPSPMYPGFVHGFLYDTDFKLTTRKETNLPLDFNAPTHGVFSSRTDNGADATWINMMVRPDHYLGGGHHHADAGMFHFSALGVNWITESPFNQVYAGKYHNQVLVDGMSEPDGNNGLGTGYQAAATYMGDATTKGGSFATADLTNSYTYRWQTQPGIDWGQKLGSLGWELDPSEQNLRTFAGTSRFKMRPWWATYNYSNYMATSRSKYNPMEYVYRSVGLVRGKHAYGVVMDDLKKDNQTHLYQWTAMLNGGVWQAEYKGLATNQIVLAYGKYDDKSTSAKSFISPSKGDPLLLVCSLNTNQETASGMPLIKVSTEEGPAGQNKAVTKATYYDRLAINIEAAKVNYHVLLIPFKCGDELPTIKSVDNKTTITWKDGQTDVLEFKTDATNRTKVIVMRDGKEVVESK